MSEKRLIDFDEFQAHHSYGAYCPGIECCEENCKPWQELKRPTLADVCGTRTLDSMTEEEMKEIQKLAVEWMSDPFKITKWYIEKGFNVWEGK